MNFSPFRNESDAVTLGNLKIENREDRIAIYGSLAITRDRAGLADAKALKSLLDRIVKELEDGPAAAGRGRRGGANGERSRTHSA